MAIVRVVPQVLTVGFWGELPHNVGNALLLGDDGDADTDADNAAPGPVGIPDCVGDTAQMAAQEGMGMGVNVQGLDAGGMGE